MAVILGIDLGTQSLKTMLLDSEKGPLNIQSEPYDISILHPGWAEEDPEIWWQALKACMVRMRLAQPAAFAAIESVGFSGQMHGLVSLDAENRPVCPAIIWVDQRAKEQVEEIEAAYSFEELAEVMHNRVFTGFGFPSLLWIKQQRPEVFARIHKVCAPKDYLRLRLIGGIVETDVSDASSWTGFDFAGRNWNWSVIDRFGLDRTLFAACHESDEIAGCITADASAETGIPVGAKVIYGSGDMPALLLGVGLCREGTAVVNIGTGATYSCYSKKDVFDSKLRMQELCNSVDASYILCGAILSGGLCLSWLKNKVLGISDYATLNGYVREVSVGSDGLVFLPHLGGERAPHMDFNASGLFFGMRHVHDKRHFCRAVMEGVSFALKDCARLMSENGVDSQEIIASGGGAKSPEWLQIQADILEKQIVVTASEEEASLGACLLAGVGTAVFGSAREACDRMVHFQPKRYEPNMKNVSVYREIYEIYRSLYPQLKDLMKRNVR